VLDSLLGRIDLNRCAVDPDDTLQRASRSGSLHPAQDLEQRCLARAVIAKHPVNLARPHRERKVGQGSNRAVTLGHVLQFKNKFGAHGSPLVFQGQHPVRWRLRERAGEADVRHNCEGRRTLRH